MFRKLILASFALCLLMGTAFAQTMTVTDIWARATPPGATTAAIYLTIKPADPAGDRLVGVMADVSEKGQIHTMYMEDGVMRMRWLKDGLVLPAGEETALSPSGAHIMLIGLKQQLVAGQKIPLTLTFEKAGTVQTEAEVKPIGYSGKDNAKAQDYSPR